LTANAKVRPEWVDPSLYPFKDNWVSIDGHSIHYVDEGPQGATVLLFVHPGPGWSFSYRYHVRALSGDFRCVAPDLPGYGLSNARPSYGYTLREQAQLLQDFVIALDLKDIVAWGNDGGGPTAILALSDLVERVTGLVMAGTFGWSIRDYHSVTRTLRIATSWPARFFNRYTNLIAASTATRFALGERRLTKAEKKHYTKPFSDRGSRSRPLKLFASFTDADTQESLDSASRALREKPVLVQFGDHDPMTGQKWPERWAKEFPNNHVVILPGVRHFTFEGAPEETVKNFKEWWNKLSPVDPAPLVLKANFK
jgi:haloalkane dehalogenase